jgi:hypothetical protein
LNEIRSDELVAVYRLTGKLTKETLMNPFHWARTAIPQSPQMLPPEIRTELEIRSKREP